MPKLYEEGRMKSDKALAKVLDAWNKPGPFPAYHERMKDKVRHTMPVLAKALDEASKEN